MLLTPLSPFSRPALTFVRVPSGAMAMDLPLAVTASSEFSCFTARLLSPREMGMLPKEGRPGGGHVFQRRRKAQR